MSDDPQPPPAWTPDDTERWLSANPLPQDFTWPHRETLEDGAPNLQPVLPTYRLHKGYGFWLRTTPYFPGLFEEVHRVLLGIGEELPTSDQMAELLKARRALHGHQLNIFN